MKRLLPFLLLFVVHWTVTDHFMKTLGEWQLEEVHQ